MSRLIELTEKALNSGLSEAENDEFAKLWTAKAEGFEEAAEIMQTDSLLSGMLHDSNVERAVFEEILSRSSDRAASNVLEAIRLKKEPVKHDISSIRRREKASYYPIIFSIAALLVIGFTLFIGLRQVDTDSLASIQSLDGVITLKRHGKERHLDTSSLIKPGDEIVTDSKSKIDVKLTDGTGLNIEESTSLAVNKKDDAWELTLTEGTVKTKVSPQKKSFKMKTPALEVKVLGTQFAVTHVNGVSTVTVFEGKVATTAFADGHSTILTAGQSFSADKKHTISDTSGEKLLFFEDFESGRLSSKIQYAEQLLSKDGPWGNNSKWIIESLVSIQTDPKKKKYEVRGPVWESDQGIFSYQPGMKIKFKYWLNENNFWLGVWMRVNKRNINLYTSIENPAVKRWAEAEIDLSTLSSKVTEQKLNPGDIINRLNLQSNPDSKAILFIDDVRVVEE